MTLSQWLTAIAVGLAFAATIGMPLWYAYKHPPKD